MPILPLKDFAWQGRSEKEPVGVVGAVVDEKLNRLY